MKDQEYQGINHLNDEFTQRRKGNAKTKAVISYGFWVVGSLSFHARRKEKRRSKSARFCGVLNLRLSAGNIWFETEVSVDRRRLFNFKFLILIVQGAD